MNISEVSPTFSSQTSSVSNASHLENPNHSTQSRWLELVSSWVNHLSGNSEPIIREIPQKTGSSLWQIYDPHTQSKITCTSESEVRVWIEQHYSAK
ncbi:hypothetical protein [Thermoleptolyngbya sp. C42_A2020_037]|uniref:hypothetical protein n=1 Tax=Thermoleptolyngbya sp. C42_A2020_037 TaxID=2747799 RepID=UPI001A0046BC|nr:hypothetical protein [Thermoleptolyngbya sp. C42_A2020_037]MBF2085770.1 hypothetical protein [Thermoleptolyngbya sp. C42_A2020_037]